MSRSASGAKTQLMPTESASTAVSKPGSPYDRLLPEGRQRARRRQVAQAAYLLPRPALQVRADEEWPSSLFPE